MQKFRRENLGEVGQFLDSNVNFIARLNFSSVVTTEDAKAARKSAVLVALFSIVGAGITYLFAPTRTFILAALFAALFAYASYPVICLWWTWFDTLGRKYYREYGPLSTFREPTLKEALEESDVSRVRSLGLRLVVVVCAVVVLNWLHPSR
jgi:hypothetical protein